MFKLSKSLFLSMSLLFIICLQTSQVSQASVIVSYSNKDDPNPYHWSMYTGTIGTLGLFMSIIAERRLTPITLGFIGLVLLNEGESLQHLEVELAKRFEFLEDRSTVSSLANLIIDQIEELPITENSDQFEIKLDEQDIREALSVEQLSDTQVDTVLKSLGAY
jgi:hypothetical protein